MSKLSLKSIERAAAHLSAGELVAVPTETVYGLAADASNDIAIARIFAAKARPSFNPLIVHVPDLTMAAMLGRFSTLALQLATEFWPGPLTLVVPRRANIPVSKLISAGLDTIALRVPAAPIARDLLAAFGKPFAAPSANPSGQISPTTAPHVRNGLGDKVAMILDGGPCPVGIESTILAIDENDVTLLRPGGVAIEEIEALIGPVTRPTSSAILAPGMMKRHYAPKAKLRLNAKAPDQDESYIGFGPSSPEENNLSPRGDLIEAAANLFAVLHAVDETAKRIAIAPIPMSGLGIAINDRLARAAADK